ncbi:hypothetical protein Kpol_1023p13 [Vanderwaltozyma polyspora DSM 70294]|uniref:Ubiquitin thioesterase OTU n=1 Tax=Vanderwaltozyma polyspora (strain ATCC 22028 / DSM 70294 / BCRC 21397 / CBS 2163 / NBRC 10782 / NRRL Y-8283 / UCD 57-17) TaxID=436907 RepID=A7TFN6_VANPO|nr:uncharacterized protein Kpol_1023p13 [Vanderwaltozyma polyspora DSM 70294]EDO18844.1 hypothetical protein Kpol_1023p13 [Vanderwaltozyma polyspora DSM 70294]
MRLKISGAEGFNKVVTIDNDATLQDLVKVIDLNTSITSMRYGYPPIKLVLDEHSLGKNLGDLNISSGEKISISTESESSSGGIISGGSIPKVQETGILKENQVYIDLPEGDTNILQSHVVPDDNSCLFHAISYCIYKDIGLSNELRSVVSQEILSNKQTYNEAILEKSNSEYANWIMKKDSWGGGIEIAILSEKTETAIYVIDIDASKIEKFNEDKYSKFIMVVFNGIHYDAIELENGQTVFDKENELLSNIVLSGGLKIASQLKSSGYSFNTRKDKIICNICKKIMVGERQVARHAEETGHVDFGQA